MKAETLDASEFKEKHSGGKSFVKPNRISLPQELRDGEKIAYERRRK